ncbi:MAG TPA: H-type small acid-soluble spore protein [Clostridia bacterium]|nr:H-type small acid-soluble spore protein [Clostridia bacterium]
MDKGRASTIVSLPTMVDVTYNGKPIYIESVNDNKETAMIHTLSEPSNRQEVPVSSLMEH